MSRFDPPSFLLAIGLLYLAFPAVVWALLNRRQPTLPLLLWCCSGALLSLSFVLYGLRAQLPPFQGLQLAHAAGFSSALLVIAVLRLERRRPTRWPWLLGCGVVAVLAALASQQIGGLVARQATVHLMNGVAAAVISLEAWRLSRPSGGRSARTLSLMYGLVALLLTARGLQVALQPPRTGIELFTLITLLVSLATAVVSNVAYMGLVLERARDAARQQRHAMDGLREQQHALENAARTREAIAGERARTTRLLAHEVRQPLHNAAVALQSGVATLEHSRDAGEAARAIEQAQAVIRRISATLDNTVAATTMLAAEDRISTADADLQMLIDLCLGDLSPQARARIRVDYRADARSAQLEASLMRLALRNLLTNATLYAPPDTPVTLRVLDSDEPLALVLEVADLGPGIEPTLRELIFEEGVRGAATVPGYGLGLHVVKRVARLHGGSIDWRPNEPQGSVFRLTLPQGDPR